MGCRGEYRQGRRTSEGLDTRSAGIVINHVTHLEVVGTSCADILDEEFHAYAVTHRSEDDRACRNVGHRGDALDLFTDRVVVGVVVDTVADNAGNHHSTHTRMELPFEGVVEVLHRGKRTPKDGVEMDDLVDTVIAVNKVGGIGRGDFASTEVTHAEGYGDGSVAGEDPLLWSEDGLSTDIVVEREEMIGSDSAVVVLVDIGGQNGESPKVEGVGVVGSNREGRIEAESIDLVGCNIAREGSESRHVGAIVGVTYLHVPEVVIAKVLDNDPRVDCLTVAARVGINNVDNTGIRGAAGTSDAEVIDSATLTVVGFVGFGCSVNEAELETLVEVARETITIGGNPVVVVAIASGGAGED